MSKCLKATIVWLSTLAFCLTVAVAVTQDKPLELPKALEKEAAAAFADGKAYYIWRENREPITPESSPLTSMLLFGVSYKRNPQKNALPFKIRIELEATNEDGKTQVLSTTSPVQNKTEETGKVGSLFASGLGVKLVGEGRAKIYFLDATTDRKAPQVSNVVSVEVKFPK